MRPKQALQGLGTNGYLGALPVKPKLSCCCMSDPAPPSTCPKECKPHRRLPDGCARDACADDDEAASAATRSEERLSSSAICCAGATEQAWRKATNPSASCCDGAQYTCTRDVVEAPPASSPAHPQCARALSFDTILASVSLC
jgi:hypothetical protein